MTDEIKIGLRIAGALSVLILFIFLIWFVLLKPAHDRRLAREALGKAAVATGSANATLDAQAIVIDSGKKMEAAKELTRENENEIRSAEGSSVVVGSDANLAGLRALCRRPTYSADERCRELLKAHP